MLEHTTAYAIETSSYINCDITICILTNVRVNITITKYGDI